MAIFHNKVIYLIAQEIEKTLKEAYPESELKLEEIYSSIGETPNLKMGHFAFPCFPLARVCKTSPAIIAKNLASKVENSEQIIKAIDQGPYLNFFVSQKAIGDLEISEIISGDFFNRKLKDESLKVMVEYSQPNTHKELHVGHMRNLCLGNAVVRMLNYTGDTAISSTYPGDMGTHVAKCLWYLKFHNTEEAPKNHKGPWLGKMYSLASKKLESENGTEKEEINRTELTKILKQLESEEGEYYDLWKETREWSIELMKDVYDWADVKFDRWYSESEVDARSLNIAKDFYEKGLFIKDDGAIGMDLKDDKLGFCIMIKSDGTGMYATKDIALALEKFENFGLDKSIYVVDTRQEFHFKQVFKVLEKVGFKHAKDCHHLKYDFVELPEGAMSSRKGNIIPMTDLINNMEATIKSQYLNKYETEWTSEEIDSTAKMIANGAIKYGMIRMDNSRSIVFDMKEWLKLDGETGPYLQYVHARIYSLCQKLGYSEEEKVDWNLLSRPQEEALMLKLTYFNSTVLTACSQYKTSSICSYLYELGKLFNSFYAECPIGKAETEDLKNTRLALANAVGKTMANGLAILGINSPKRM